MARRELQNHFSGKVALVTGGSDGIGRACADELRARGAQVALTGRSEEKLRSAAGPGDLVLPADLTHAGTARELVERTMARFGRIDILLNVAGHGIYWPVADSPLAEARALFDVNFFAPLALAQAAIPQMRRQGSGVVVNVGSIAGRVALPWMPLYSASKSAVGALTDSLRQELKADGIHAMLVCPGYVLTEFHAHSLGLRPPRKVVDGKRFAITPQQCARDILRGIENRAKVVVTPRWGWFLIGLHALLPAAVEARLAELNRAA